MHLFKSNMCQRGRGASTYLIIAVAPAVAMIAAMMSVTRHSAQQHRGVQSSKGGIAPRFAPTGYRLPQRTA